MKTNIEYSSTKLNTIITRVKNGEIKIPPFQRTFDWSAKDMARFYNSIVEGDPFGSIMLWNDDSNTTKIKQTNHYFNKLSGEVSSETTKTYLIDGQQRLTTFIMLYLKHNNDKHNAKYLTKTETVFFDLSDLKFYSGKKKATSFYGHHFFKKSFKELRQFIQSDINNIDNILSVNNKDEMELFEEIKDIYDSFNNVSVGKTEVFSSNLDEVINIFTLINTKGKRLSSFNIVHAYYVSEKYDLDGQFQKIIKTFKKEKWGEFTKSQLLILAYSALYQTISNGEIMKKSINAIKQSDINYINNEFENDLKESVEIIKKRLFIPRLDFVPSMNIMNLIIRLVRQNKNDKKKMYDVDYQILKEWVKLAIINERYVSGSEGIKQPGYEKDYEVIEKALASGKSISKIDVPPRWIKTNSFDSNAIKFENYNSGSATYKYAISMIIKYIPSISTGQSVSLNSIVKVKDLNIHHIFPKGNKNYVDNEFINSLGNLTPLERDSNLEFDNEDPNIYIKRLKDANKISKNNLKKCFIDLTKLKDINELINYRSEKITKILNENNNITK